MQVRENDLEKLMDEEHILKALLQEKQQIINNLKMCIQDQDIKLNRVTQNLQKLNQEIETDPNWVALREVNIAVCKSLIHSQDVDKVDFSGCETTSHT